jgi:hypothetical protein
MKINQYQYHATSYIGICNGSVKNFEFISLESYKKILQKWIPTLYQQFQLCMISENMIIDDILKIRLIITVSVVLTPVSFQSK